VMLGLFAFLGIGPLLGPKFKAALHIPAKVGAAVGIVLVVMLVVVQQQVGLPGSAIIIGIINVAGALGFSPAWAPTV
jgi:phosphate starvation-inducible membrane PsiE